MHHSLNFFVTQNKFVAFGAQSVDFISVSPSVQFQKQERLFGYLPECGGIRVLNLLHLCAL